MLAFCMGVHPQLGGGGCALASTSADALPRIGAAAQGLSGAYLHKGESLLHLRAAG